MRYYCLTTGVIVGHNLSMWDLQMIKAINARPQDFPWGISGEVGVARRKTGASAEAPVTPRIKKKKRGK